MGVLKDGDVSISVTWEKSDAWVFGRYRVTNAGAAQLYLLDRLYHRAISGARTVDPEHAFRWLEPDGVYRVAKFVPNIPTGERVESPEVAYARVLPPHGLLEGTVLLPGQLDQILPYEAEAALPSVAKINSIVFSVGYAEIDAEATAVEIGKGDAAVLSLPYEWLITRQRIVSTVAVAIEVPMQVKP